MSKLNEVMSVTNSHVVRSEGKDVAIFSSDASELPEIFESIGFKRHYRKGTRLESMPYYQTNQFFNEESQESIFLSHANNGEWTFSGSDCEPTTTASMALQEAV